MNYQSRHYLLQRRRERQEKTKELAPMLEHGNKGNVGWISDSASTKNRTPVVDALHLSTLHFLQIAGINYLSQRRKERKEKKKEQLGIISSWRTLRLCESYLLFLFQTAGGSL